MPLPDAYNPSPQTYQATLMMGGARLAGVITDPAGGVIPRARVKVLNNSGSLLAETTTNAGGAYELVDLPEGELRVEVESPGFKKAALTGLRLIAGQSGQGNLRLEIGEVTQTEEVRAAAPDLQTSSTERSSSGRMLGSGAALGRGSGGGVGSGRGSGFGTGEGGGIGGGIYRTGGIPARAVARELGDLFEYKVKEPISIPKNQSALVPIVQTEVDAEKVSIWNAAQTGPRPQRGLWLTNSSGVTLDGGSFGVLEEDAFAGEGIFDAMQAGEKRLVAYATDLALNASSRQESEKQRVARVRVKEGIMIFESEAREKSTYTFRNEDKAARTVIVEHPARPGYKLRGTAEPAETTREWLRFRLRVEPKQNAALTVDEVRPIVSTVALSQLSEQQLAVFVKDGSITKTMEEAFQRVLARRAVVGGLESEKRARESEQEQIFDDQQRLRENIKSLRGTAEEKALLQRYTQRLNQQEDRLEALHKEISALEDKISAAQAEADRMTNEVAFEVELSAV